MILKVISLILRMPGFAFFKAHVQGWVGAQIKQPFRQLMQFGVQGAVLAPTRQAAGLTFLVDLFECPLESIGQGEGPFDGLHPWTDTGFPG